MKRDPAPRIDALPDVLTRANAAPVFQADPFARVLALVPGGRAPDHGLLDKAGDVLT